jgi:cytochrome c oxidase assembly protein subunit 15
LATTVLVILWGAWVRVSGSGAGCADHWPLCNGELVPRSPTAETLIELTHRVTSSLCGLLSIVVFVRARREFAPGTPVRRAALAGLWLMLLEGAVGAMLVKLGLVAKDSSPARALVVGLHLVNTFLLLAAQLLTVLFARGLPAPRWRGRGGLGAVLGLALACVLSLGATGAITALGDTLFPAESLAHGLAQDLSPQAHFLIRLRMWHPLLAVLCGAGVVYLAQHLKALHPGQGLERWALALTLLYLAQLAAGAANLLLLAPALLQITHLLLADLVWLALVGLSVEALATQEVAATSELERASA